MIDEKFIDKNKKGKRLKNMYHNGSPVWTWTDEETSVPATLIDVSAIMYNTTVNWWTRGSILKTNKVKTRYGDPDINVADLLPDGYIMANPTDKIKTGEVNDIKILRQKYIVKFIFRKPDGTLVSEYTKDYKNGVVITADDVELPKDYVLKDKWKDKIVGTDPEIEAGTITCVIDKSIPWTPIDIGVVKHKTTVKLTNGGKVVQTITVESVGPGDIGNAIRAKIDEKWIPVDTNKLIPPGSKLEYPVVKRNINITVNIKDNTGNIIKTEKIVVGNGKKLNISSKIQLPSPYKYPSSVENIDNRVANDDMDETSIDIIATKSVSWTMINSDTVKKKLVINYKSGNNVIFTKTEFRAKNDPFIPELPDFLWWTNWDDPIREEYGVLAPELDRVKALKATSGTVDIALTRMWNWVDINLTAKNNKAKEAVKAALKEFDVTPVINGDVITFPFTKKMQKLNDSKDYAELHDPHANVFNHLDATIRKHLVDKTDGEIMIFGVTAKGVNQDVIKKGTINTFAKNVVNINDPINKKVSIDFKYVMKKEWTAINAQIVKKKYTIKYVFNNKVIHTETVNTTGDNAPAITPPVGYKRNPKTNETLGDHLTITVPVIEDINTFSIKFVLDVTSDVPANDPLRNMFTNNVIHIKKFTFRRGQYPLGIKDDTIRDIIHDAYTNIPETYRIGLEYQITPQDAFRSWWYNTLKVKYASANSLPDDGVITYNIKQINPSVSDRTETYMWDVAYYSPTAGSLIVANGKRNNKVITFPDLYALPVGLLNPKGFNTQALKYYTYTDDDRYRSYIIYDDYDKKHNKTEMTELYNASLKNDLNALPDDVFPIIIKVWVDDVLKVNKTYMKSDLTRLANDFSNATFKLNVYNPTNDGKHYRNNLKIESNVLVMPSLYDYKTHVFRTRSHPDLVCHNMNKLEEELSYNIIDRIQYERSYQFIGNDELDGVIRLYGDFTIKGLSGVLPKFCTDYRPGDFLPGVIPYTVAPNKSEDSRYAIKRISTDMDLLPSTKSKVREVYAVRNVSNTVYSKQQTLRRMFVHSDQVNPSGSNNTPSALNFFTKITKDFFTVEDKKAILDMTECFADAVFIEDKNYSAVLDKNPDWTGLRKAIKYWRDKGYKVVLKVDDAFSCSEVPLDFKFGFFKEFFDGCLTINDEKIIDGLHTMSRHGNFSSILSLFSVSKDFNDIWKIFKHYLPLTDDDNIINLNSTHMPAQILLNILNKNGGSNSYTGFKHVFDLTEEIKTTDVNSHWFTRISNQILDVITEYNLENNLFTFDDNIWYFKFKNKPIKQNEDILYTGDDFIKNILAYGRTNSIKYENYLVEESTSRDFPVFFNSHKITVLNTFKNVCFMNRSYNMCVPTVIYNPDGHTVKKATSLHFDNNIYVFNTTPTNKNSNYIIHDTSIFNDVYSRIQKPTNTNNDPDTLPNIIKTRCNPVFPELNTKISRFNTFYNITYLPLDRPSRDDVLIINKFSYFVPNIRTFYRYDGDEYSYTYNFSIKVFSSPINMMTSAYARKYLGNSPYLEYLDGGSINISVATLNPWVFNNAWGYIECYRETPKHFSYVQIESSTLSKLLTNNEKGVERNRYVKNLTETTSAEVDDHNYYMTKALNSTQEEEIILMNTENFREFYPERRYPITNDTNSAIGFNSALPSLGEVFSIRTNFVTSLHKFLGMQAHAIEDNAVKLYHTNDENNRIVRSYNPKLEKFTNSDIIYMSAFANTFMKGETCVKTPHLKNINTVFIGISAGSSRLPIYTYIRSKHIGEVIYKRVYNKIHSLEDIANAEKMKKTDGNPDSPDYFYRIPGMGAWLYLTDIQDVFMITSRHPVTMMVGEIYLRGLKDGDPEFFWNNQSYTFRNGELTFDGRVLLELFTGYTEYEFNTLPDVEKEKYKKTIEHHKRTLTICDLRVLPSAFDDKTCPFVRPNDPGREHVYVRDTHAVISSATLTGSFPFDRRHPFEVQYWNYDQPEYTKMTESNLSSVNNTKSYKKLFPDQFNKAHTEHLTANAIGYNGSKAYPEDRYVDFDEMEHGSLMLIFTLPYNYGLYIDDIMHDIIKDNTGLNISAFFDKYNLTGRDEDSPRYDEVIPYHRTLTIKIDWYKTVFGNNPEDFDWDDVISKVKDLIYTLTNVSGVTSENYWRQIAKTLRSGYKFADISRGVKRQDKTDGKTYSAFNDVFIVSDLDTKKFLTKEPRGPEDPLDVTLYAMFGSLPPAPRFEANGKTTPWTRAELDKIPGFSRVEYIGSELLMHIGEATRDFSYWFKDTQIRAVPQHIFNWCKRFSNTHLMTNDSKAHVLRGEDYRDSVKPVISSFRGFFANTNVTHVPDYLFWMMHHGLIDCSYMFYGCQIKYINQPFKACSGGFKLDNFYSNIPEYNGFDAPVDYSDRDYPWKYRYRRFPEEYELNKTGSNVAQFSASIRTPGSPYRVIDADEVWDTNFEPLIPEENPNEVNFYKPEVLMFWYHICRPTILKQSGKPYEDMPTIHMRPTITTLKVPYRWSPKDEKTNDVTKFTPDYVYIRRCIDWSVCREQWYPTPNNKFHILQEDAFHFNRNSLNLYMGLQQFSDILPAYIYNIELEGKSTTYDWEKTLDPMYILYESYDTNQPVGEKNKRNGRQYRKNTTLEITPVIIYNNPEYFLYPDRESSRYADPEDMKANTDKYIPKVYNKDVQGAVFSMLRYNLGDWLTAWREVCKSTNDNKTVTNGLSLEQNITITHPHSKTPIYGKNATQLANEFNMMLVNNDNRYDKSLVIPCLTHQPSKLTEDLYNYIQTWNTTGFYKGFYNVFMYDKSRKKHYLGLYIYKPIQDFIGEGNTGALDGISTEEETRIMMHNMVDVVEVLEKVMEAVKFEKGIDLDRDYEFTDITDPKELEIIDFIFSRSSLPPEPAGSLVYVYNIIFEEK